MREILTSSHWPAPRFRYSPLVKAGPFYHTAGMVALDHESRLVGGGPKAETRQILANLQRALPDFKLKLTDLVTATIYTTRFDCFSEINEAWEEVFTSDVPPPARTSIGVAQLPLGATVEMQFCLYKA